MWIVVKAAAVDDPAVDADGGVAESVGAAARSAYLVGMATGVRLSFGAILATLWTIVASWSRRTAPSHMLAPEDWRKETAAMSSRNKKLRE